MYERFEDNHIKHCKTNTSELIESKIVLHYF